MTARLLAESHLGRPVSAHGVTVVPLFPRFEPVRFAEASDAIARGALRIEELPHAIVPALRAVNERPLPVFLPEGSLLLGGLQDRISEAPAWVPGGASWDVRVHCVERGRWHAVAGDGDGRAFRVARAEVGFRCARLRDEAGQDRTWALVAERRRAQGRADPGGSLRELRDEGTLARVAADLTLPWAASGALVCWDHPGVTSWPLVEYWSDPDAFRAAWPAIAVSVLQAHLDHLRRRGARAARAPWIGLSDATARLRKLREARATLDASLDDGVRCSQLRHRGATRTIEGWETFTARRLLHVGVVRG